MVSKNMNDVCVIGCSHLFGSDLDDCDNSSASKLVWPNFLFGDNIINLSKAGASCSTIARRLLLYLSQNTPKMVIIQWPNLLRWEILDNDFCYCGKDFPYQTSQMINFEFKNKAKAKFKYLNTILSDSNTVKSNIETIIMVNHYLSARNIAIKNLYASEFPSVEWPKIYSVRDKNESESDWNRIYKKILDNNSNECFTEKNLILFKGDPYDPYIQLLKNQIELFPTVSFNGHSWVNWCQQNGYSCKGDSYHYEEKAHIDAAQILKNTQVKEVLKIT
jgi:hypothetical protein